MKTLNAVYLGNTDNEYCGFKVDKTYEVYTYGDGDIGAYDEDGGFRHIKNGAFHKFGIPTESDCVSKSPVSKEKPGFKYYINGHEVDPVEFDGAQSHVAHLDHSGVKCDTIKFEVKFE